MHPSNTWKLLTSFKNSRIRVCNTICSACLNFSELSKSLSTIWWTGFPQTNLARVDATQAWCWQYQTFKLKNESINTCWVSNTFYKLHPTVVIPLNSPTSSRLKASRCDWDTEFLVRLDLPSIIKEILGNFLTRLEMIMSDSILLHALGRHEILGNI